MVSQNDGTLSNQEHFCLLSAHPTFASPFQSLGMHPLSSKESFELALARHINAQPRIEHVSRQWFLESQNQVPLEILRVKPRRVKHLIFGNHFGMPLSQCEWNSDCQCANGTLSRKQLLNAPRTSWIRAKHANTMKNQWRITSGDWFLPQKEYWQPNRHHDFVIASQHLLLALKAVQNWFSFDATSRLHSGFWMPIVFMGSLQWKRATSSYAKLAVSGLKRLNLPVGASGLKAEMKQGSKCTAQEGANPHDPEILQHAALSWCLASFRSLWRSMT